VTAFELNPRSKRLRWLLLCAACSGGCQSGGTSGPSTDDCADACSKIAAVDCGDADAQCVDRCVRSTQIPSDVTCRSERANYVDCFWSAESYACDDDGNTTATGCDEQRAAFERCDSGEGGAGGAEDTATTTEAGAGGAPG
jgi:hypothetical protein